MLMGHATQWYKSGHFKVVPIGTPHEQVKSLWKFVRNQDARTEEVINPL